MNLGQLVSGLAPVASAAGDAVLGYRQDKEDIARKALQQRTEARQASQDAIAQSLAAANISHLDAQSFAALHPRVTPEPLESTVGPDNKPVLTPRSQAAGKTPFIKPDAPSFTPVTLGGGEGQPAVVKPFNNKTGTVGAPVGEAKPAATRVESAMNTAAKARLKAAISEMNNAHSNMDEFEGRLSRGEVNIGGLQQVLGRVANAFTHDDPLSQLTQSGALATLNKTNPDLARYIRRGLSFAEGESMISQRPSDFRTKMAAFLSTAASGASPEMIADIQGRRKSILDPLNATGAEEPNRATPAKAGSDPEFDALMAKHRKKP